MKMKRFDINEAKMEFLRLYKELIKKFPDKEVFILSDIDFDFSKDIRQIHNIHELNADLISDSLFIPYFESDADSIDQIKVIKQYDGRFYSPCLTIQENGARAVPPSDYTHINRNAMKAYEDLVKDAEMFGIDKIANNIFCKKDHLNIMQAIEITKHLSGDYVEIGVFMGASALAALHFMKHSNINRECYFLDTYDGFNYEESKTGIDAFWYKTHKIIGVEDTVNTIRSLFSRFDIRTNVVISNICRDDLPDNINRIAVCNIDVDQHEAVSSALFKVADSIVPYGIIIAEDAGHTPLLYGALLALTEFLESDKGKDFMPIKMESGQTFLIRKGSHNNEYANL